MTFVPPLEPRSFTIGKFRLSKVKARWTLLMPRWSPNAKSVFLEHPPTTPLLVLAPSLNLSTRQSVFSDSPYSSGSSVSSRSSLGISICLCGAIINRDLFAAILVAASAPRKPSPLCGSKYSITSLRSSWSIVPKNMLRCYKVEVEQTQCLWI